MRISAKNASVRAGFWPAIVVISIAMLMLFAGHFLTKSTLPSDEQMIAHFNKHRLDFDVLVKKFRGQRIDATGTSNPQSFERSKEIVSLKQKLHIYHIARASPVAKSWYPDHYSLQTREALKGMYWNKTIQELPTEQILLLAHLKSFPSLFPDSNPVRTIVDVWYLTDVVDITPGSLSRPIEEKSIRFMGAKIRKAYFNFPFPPLIKDGRIVVHDFRNSDSLGVGQRVLSLLDEYPDHFKPGECVLRRIDDYWFLAKCKGR